MDLKIVAFDNKNSPEIIRIRTKVFIEEQGVDKTIEIDGRDDDALHALVLNTNTAIATARILEDGHIGRIAVLKEFRKQGAGALALKAMMEVTAKRGDKRVFLSSQTQATGFYLKMGFRIYGDTFLDAGIEHINMEYFIS